MPTSKNYHNIGFCSNNIFSYYLFIYNSSSPLTRRTDLVIQKRLIQTPNYYPEQNHYSLLNPHFINYFNKPNPVNTKNKLESKHNSNIQTFWFTSLKFHYKIETSVKPIHSYILLLNKLPKTIFLILPKIYAQISDELLRQIYKSRIRKAHPPTSFSQEPSRCFTLHIHWSHFGHPWKHKWLGF